MARKRSEGKNLLVIPTRVGKDLDNQDRTIDSHIRIETYKHNETNIYVDIFDSCIEDASQAYLTSETFPYTKSGSNEASKYLQNIGFRVQVDITRNA